MFRGEMLNTLKLTRNSFCCGVVPEVVFRLVRRFSL